MGEKTENGKEASKVIAKENELYDCESSSE